ncbi:hypothetical protein niasHT_035491 [Heterodera trifolii]|uniref:Uncharacterized protein n=1 Tax=Heterodera trifolii TaxID=157864 RepID=A0ABD2I314_9BILA
MSNSFFVFLPSNVTDYPDNQPNKFRVRLPKALNFNGSWVCGLHSISYPYSWSTIGTLDEQWIDIHFTDIGVAEEDKHRIVRVPVPRSSQNRVEQLRDFLTTTLRNHVNAKLKPLPREEEADRNRTKPLYSPPSAKRARRDLKLSSPPRYEKALAKPLDSPPKHVQTPAKPLDSPPRYEKAPAKPLDSPPRHEQVPKQPLDSPPLYDESKQQKPQKSPEKPATTKPPTPSASTPPPIPKSVAPAVVPKLSQPIAPVAPPTPTAKPVATHPPAKTPSFSSPPPAKTPPPPAKTPPPPPPAKTSPPPPAKTASPPPPAKTASPPPPAKTTSPPSPAKTASPLPPAKTASPPPLAAKQPSSVNSTPASKIKPAKTVQPPPPKQKTPSKPSVSPILESPPRDDESNRTIVKSSPPRLEEANKTIAKPTTFDTKEVMPTEPVAAALTQLADLPENILSIRINPLPVVPRSVSIQYLDDVERFKVSFNAGLIRHLSFSPQLGYVLGFENPQHKVSLMDGLALDIARKLELKPARYAVRKTLMKSLFISHGRFEFTSNLFMDQIPRRITMGLVANADYVGTLSRSPFNFQPFNVREISIIANGRSYPQAAYDLDYPNWKYVRPFNDMNEAVGFANSSESNGITLEQFGLTHCIYVFNLTSSGDDQAALFDLIRNGTTAVSIKFNQAVPAGGIMLVVMGECDSLVMLDKNRSISTDITI